MSFWSWFRFHHDCEKRESERRAEITASLRAHIDDLQSQIRELYEVIAQKDEAASDRERALLDRLIAMTNPGAIRVMQGPAPVQAQSPIQASNLGPPDASRPAPALDPSRVSYSTSKPKRAPILTPKDAKFRPLIRQEADKLARAQAEIDKMVRDNVNVAQTPTPAPPLAVDPEVGS